MRLHLAFGLVTGTIAMAPAQDPITFASLVRDARDLGRLCKAPDPEYDLVQWSSTDRRSTAPESPGWFANADGFGGEPIPGVAAVIEEPGPNGVGEYLIGEMQGEGAIVRTWSAGMNGRIRLILDGNLVWDGEAIDFMCHRAKALLMQAGLPSDADQPARALEMEDADYFPIPFARSVRIEWSGSLRDLHFYQVQVRHYSVRAVVRTYGADDLRAAASELEATAAAFRARETSSVSGDTRHIERHDTVPVGEETAFEDVLGDDVNGAAIVALSLRVGTNDMPRSTRERALRGTVLRISFDGSQQPQVESPIGDFFGSGPGINDFESLPMSVAADGTMTCRFPMPYHHRCRIAFRNFTTDPVEVTTALHIAPFGFDDQTLYFRAHWRTDRDIHSEGGSSPFDLPFILMRGRGRFVGCAVQIVNPSGVPTPGGNWWGEGDEKVFVDGEPLPTTLGTGSEDYFDYSWSRPNLFAHPYCGQPLCSGPGTAGFVSNHRFQILDDIPFKRFLGFWMEVWTHRPLDRLEYARITWCYARPQALDDHVRIQPRDVELPELPVRAPVADGGARGATLRDAWDMLPKAKRDAIAVEPDDLATRRRLLVWHPDAGDTLALSVPITTPGEQTINLVMMEQPGGGAIEAKVGGVPVAIESQGVLDLQHATRRQLRSFAIPTPALPAGEVALELTCARAGAVALDYAWIKLAKLVVPGCIEGEAMTVVRASDGLERQVQDLDGAIASGGKHLWVKSLSEGDFIVLRATAPSPGRWRAHLRLTRSWDYAILAVTLQGKRCVDRVDTCAPRLGALEPLDLGECTTGDDGIVELRLDVVGSNPDSKAPHTYFGVDGLVLDALR
ncbi:MAG: glycoside hydrolase family 172 protein [Planctomycetota bacterium]